MVVGLKPILLALIAALVLHIAGLVGVSSQLQVTSLLAQRSDPLFTRTIEAASEPTVVAIAGSPVLAGEPKHPVAAAAAPSVALDTTDTAKVNALEPQLSAVQAVLPPPAAPTPSSGVADATPAPLAEPAAAVSSSQSVTTQALGEKDSLLSTGDWPADTRVTYKLSGFFQGELYGDGQVQWTREGAAGERYQVRVTVNAGLIDMTMTSQGSVSPDGLLPQAYEEVIKRILGKPRVRTLKLEPRELVLDDQRRVARPASSPEAVQDIVSQFIDLGHRLQQGRAELAEGEVIRIWLGRPGGLDEWVYDVGPEEIYTLPRVGPVRVHQLKPRPLANPRGTITMSMWLAPSLQFLPAKIRIQVNAESFVELRADRLQQR